MSELRARKHSKHPAKTECFSRKSHLPTRAPSSKFEARARFGGLGFPLC